MKRFTVRKRNQYAMSRQGWMLSDPKPVWWVYDRQWKENLAVKGQTFIEKWEEDSRKYIDYSYNKNTAQYWADWLNTNQIILSGLKPIIPGNVYTDGLTVN